MSQEKQNEQNKEKVVKDIFKEIISLYDFADEIENNGEEEKATDMRLKLNAISAFFVANFEKELDS